MKKGIQSKLYWVCFPALCVFANIVDCFSDEKMVRKIILVIEKPDTLFQAHPCEKIYVERK